MGNYSRDTFKINEKKHYVNVRLQQGVPLVDADWNEMDDIRKYEFEKFLAKFIGNGAPSEDDFRIIPLNGGSENDFIINRGYCLVNGHIVINEEEIKYSNQQLPPLKVPENNTRIDTVYLDVWEREVNSDEDKDLKLKYTGSELETCVRIKREWVVQVAEGIEGSYEAANLPSVPYGHNYYILATLVRNPREDIIGDKNIIDQRLGINLEEIFRLLQSLYLYISRIHKVPLLQQTLHGRTVPLASIKVEDGPWSIAFDGTHIWVVNFISRSVSKIDIVSNTMTLVEVDVAPVNVAFDGKYIWVIGEEGLTRIDIITMEREIYGTHMANWGVAFDGKYIWVTNRLDKGVGKINTSNGSKEINVKLSGNSYRSIAFDGTHIWVANYDSDIVSKVNIESNTKVASVPVGIRPCGIAFDGTHIWVTNYKSNTVSKIDINTNAVVASVQVENGPSGIAFDGTHIWVTNHKSNTVSKIDIITNAVVASITVGSSPRGIAFDGTHIWVTNYKSNTVIKIQK